MDAVPSHGDEAADDRRDVGPLHAEDGAADHRIGRARDLARLRHEIAEDLNDEDADQQADQNLPAGEAEREQAARGDVAADAVHVGHPEGEDVVGGPGLRAQRREVLVAEAIVVLRLDDHRRMGRGDRAAGCRWMEWGRDFGHARLADAVIRECCSIIEAMYVPASRASQAALAVKALKSSATTTLDRKPVCRLTLRQNVT